MEDPKHSQSTSLMASVAAGLGVVVAVGCGFFLSEPVDSFDDSPVASATAKQENSASQEFQPRMGEVQPAQVIIGGGGRPPGMPLPEPEIVVKFKNMPVAKEICDLYWKDKAAAQEKFKSTIGAHAGLGDLRLKRVTYSNELVLDMDGPTGPLNGEMRDKYRQAIEGLRSMPETSYAEPNSTAHPGKDQ